MEAVERGFAVLVVFIAGWALGGFFQQRQRARVWVRPTRTIVLTLVIVAVLAAAELVGAPRLPTVSATIVLAIMCVVGLFSFAHARASTRAKLMKEGIADDADVGNYRSL